MVPTRCFIANSKGYPSLPPAHRHLVEHFLSKNVQAILSGEVVHAPPPEHSNGQDPPPDAALLNLYVEYLCYLFRRLPALTQNETVMRQYWDQLQVPLEPLKDNLESATYDIFEKDMPKYNAYETAIFAALMARPRLEHGSAVVIMVVGAGRGPLVTAALSAAQDCGRRVHVYAVEKNPYALVTLRVRACELKWNDRVTIVSHDMRTWEAPEKADILVSELLGSFGDNELSPECLDGAQRFLKDDGISIPSSYTSFCAPITAAKAYNYALAYKEKKKLECTYVVKFSNHALLAPPEEVATFSHPNRNANIDNSRYTRLRFRRGPRDPACLMHGLAGYFDALLYGPVSLSTVPGRHTPNMESWFSMFFPLITPIYIPQGAASIDVHFWRRVNEHKANTELQPLSCINVVCRSGMNGQ